MDLVDPHFQLVYSVNMTLCKCMLIVFRIFLWSSLFYSCCMTAQKQGPIALAGDEAQLGADDISDEQYARRVQADQA
jgi:hypothetical protein